MQALPNAHYEPFLCKSSIDTLSESRVPLDFTCKALYVKELQKEFHKIVISYVDIAAVHA